VSAAAESLEPSERGVSVLAQLRYSLAALHKIRSLANQ